MICEENSTSNATEEREARLSSVSQTKGVRVYNTFKMTKEQVFSVETGILEWTNNWLVMVEQGSRLVQDDCMVCLAPHPLLRMVPVPSELNATCIANIMANNVPSDESKQWGKIYPLTRPADQKPLFSTKVALGNFTCINGTRNSTNKLGNFNAAWCVSYIITNGSLGKMCSNVWWYCGNKVLRGNLPLNFTGICALISLVIPVQVYVGKEVRLSLEYWAKLKPRMSGAEQNETYLGREEMTLRL